MLVYETREGELKGFVLVFALLAACLVSAPAFAMEWLGTVRVKSLPVHSDRSATSAVVKSLSKNAKVVVEGQLRASSGKTWCGVRQVLKGRTLGYVDCDGLTHTMTNNLYKSLSSNPTSVSGVSTPAASTPQAAAGSNKSSRNQAQAPAKRKTTVKINGKDMTDRYKGKSAVMYMTPS